MNARQLLFAQFAVLAVLVFLFFLGLALYLHWVLWWYDILLHFLGGAWVALALLWLSSVAEKDSPSSHVIATVICVGVLWEVFEFLVGAPRESNFRFDTSLDLLMDVTGGFAALTFVRRLNIGGLASKEVVE